ncbi:hypothetical protein B0H34DRAFT_789464 [Crassisporium funariophilum]|nr:hypothetical protein B0H34DRAFT_789464 [Crassisporium funariophilum]
MLLPPVTQLTQAGRPMRNYKQPARYLDLNPEPLRSLDKELLTPITILPRVTLIVRNRLRTAVNSFNLLRQYLYRPSFDPDSFVPTKDLLDSHNSIDTVPLCPLTPPLVHRNETVELLMNWKDSGPSTKSDGEVNRLVNEVLLNPNFTLEDLRGFRAARENRQTDAADEKKPIPGLIQHSSTVIRAMFSSPLASKLHFSPFKLYYRSPSGKEEQVFCEVYDSDAFNDENDKIQRAPVPPDDPGCKREKVVLALMFWSDATHLANFGTAKLWPIYMLLGNLSKYFRSQPNSGACQHIAYIPSLPDSFQDFAANFHQKWGTQKKDILTHCRRELIHAVWKFLLDDEFLHAYRYGMVIKCADGIERRIYPRIFTYSADYPEKVLLATIWDKGLCPCPRCLIAKSKLDQTSTKRDSQFREKNVRIHLLDFVRVARDAIYQRAAKISGKVVNRLLKPTSSVPTLDFEISRILVPDLLHEFELGVWKALFTHLIRVLYAAAPNGSLVAELNKRFRDMPTFGSSAIRRFATNASEMKKLAARDFEDLLQCSIPAFEGLLPEPHNTMVRTLLYRTAEWHAFAKLRLHTESTLNRLEQITTDLGRLMRKFRDVTNSEFATFELPRESQARKRRAKGKEKEGSGNSASQKPKGLNLFTYKWHALADYVRSIRLFGGTDGFSTQLGELAHNLVKRLYGSTNKRDTDCQIAKRYRRHEQARLALERKQLRDRALKTRTEDTGDSDLRYHISASKNRPIDIFTAIRTNKGDPAYDRFLPKLQDHLLGRLKGRDFDADMHEDYTDEDRNSVRFVGEKIYSVQTCRLYYTTYDLQRDSDTVNPQTHPNITHGSPEVEEGAEPYWYARVIGARGVRRMDFLWVRWLGKEHRYDSGSRRALLPKIGFVESTDEFAFSFVDPANVVRGCHLIPAFHEGRTVNLLPVPQSVSRCLNPGDVDDWVNFYVNIFVDRDMFMRYFGGGGIGHLGNSPQPRNEAGQPETETGELEVEVDDGEGSDLEDGGENTAVQLQDIVMNSDEEEDDDVEEDEEEENSEEDGDEEDKEEDDDDDEDDEDEDLLTRPEPDESSDDGGYGSF